MRRDRRSSGGARLLPRILSSAADAGGDDYWCQRCGVERPADELRVVDVRTAPDVVGEWKSVRLCAGCRRAMDKETKR